MAVKRPLNPPPPLWRKHAWLIAVLWIAVFVAYSNSFHAGLAFDSKRVILSDSRIQADTPENVHEIWSGDYYNGTGSSALYRPLATLSYLWNYSDLGEGANPAGYHAVNFILHAINTALVYFLGLAVIGEIWPAFAMAAIWALHPVLTESVTNVVGRADLLAAFGVVAGLLCYWRLISAAGWRRIAWAVALAAATAIAVFSKESGVVLVAVLVAATLLPPLRAKSRSDAAMAAVAVLVPAAVWYSMRQAALAQVSSLLISYGDNPLLGAGFFVSRLTAVKVLARYLALLLWPVHLSPDYSYNQIPVTFDTSGMVSLLLWLGIAGAAVWAWRRARPLLFFIAFFAITIAPVANIVILIGSIMAERFLYLPSIGFAGAIVWAAVRLRAHLPAKWLAASLALVCLALGARTWARNADWSDDRTLWTSAAEVSPNSYKTHSNLAMLALDRPQPDYAAALHEEERALAILDSLPDGRNMPGVYATAGQCYRARGDLNRALSVLLRGRNIDRAWNAAFQERNRQDGKTVPLIGTPPLYLELGRTYMDLGQPDKAIEAFGEGRVIDPQPSFFEELSRAYSGMQDSGEAAISLLEGITINTGQPDLIRQLTQLYQATAPESCALNRAAVGTPVNLDCPMVHDQLCSASRNMTAMFRQRHDPASADAIARTSARNYGCPQ